MRDFASMPEKTEEQMRLFGNALLRECILYAGNEGLFFREMLEIKVSEPSFDTVSFFIALVFLSLLSRPLFSLCSISLFVPSPLSCALSCPL
jgi:hypothetical protein